jgi:nucleoid-associated protein YgaU
MALAKLTIRVETAPGKFDGNITALFNPNQITIDKSTQWRRKPKADSDTGEAQFTYGEPATLSLDLFFDTYEARTDVRDHTKEIFHLTTVQEHGNLHRPPLCKLEWGAFNISGTFQCEWVLTRLSQRFTLFLSDGTPVRATLGCSFMQWRGDEIEGRLLNKQSADVAKTRVVRSGDTLSSIAGEEYSDPGMWRSIARVNGINNPRVLAPGKVLVIPKLSPRTGIRR